MIIVNLYKNNTKHSVKILQILKLATFVFFCYFSLFLTKEEKKKENNIVIKKGERLLFFYLIKTQTIEKSPTDINNSFIINWNYIYISYKILDGYNKRDSTLEKQIHRNIV